MCLHAGFTQGKGGVPAPRAMLHTLALVLLQCWGSGTRGAHTRSCEWEGSLQIHILIYTHVYTGLPPLSCSSGASHVIFPLLSVVMELPVLLERLPNVVIGTPAMIKKKFQIRATMP